MPITALTAGENVKVLIEQARAMKPRMAVIGNETLLGELTAGPVGHRHQRSPPAARR